LAEIRAADPLALTRVAWHFGNRHLPTEITPKALRIRRDPVIEAMAEGLGARVIALEAPFNPEGGAYAKAEDGAPDSHHHGHDHHHDHDHGSVHAHDHDHDHDHGHPDRSHDHAGCRHPDHRDDHGHRQ
jgi:urease accessory protein